MEGARAFGSGTFVFLGVSAVALEFGQARTAPPQVANAG